MRSSVAFLLAGTLVVAGTAGAVAASDRLGSIPPVATPPTTADPVEVGPTTEPPRPAPTPAATPSPTEPAPAPATPSAPAPATDADTPAAPAAEEQQTEAAAPERPAYDLRAVQTRLQDLRYYVGAIDGVAGPATRSAVMAFQKVNGLGVDGVVGPRTLAALTSPVAPTLRGGPADRVEVDLTRQVLYLVRGGTVDRIVPVSSGSGEAYRTASGGTARARTPVGTFRVERHIRGTRVSPLGSLYNPLYFHKGWAIHGSPSVPAYPASHGCVRVTNWDANYLFDRVPIGMQIQVYGGTHVFGV